MDLAMRRQRLTHAENQVLVGEREVAKQRKQVEAKARLGQDTTRLRRLLAHFEEVQEMHVADRDRLREDLAKIDH